MAVLTENRIEDVVETPEVVVAPEPTITFESIEKVWNISDLKVKEKIDLLVDMITNDPFCVENEIQTTNINDYVYSPSIKPLRSRVFPLELKPYEFKLVGITYACESRNEGDIANPLKWHVDRFYEFEYSLGRKVATIRKNGRELKFSENNLTALFAGFQTGTIIKWFDKISDSTTYSDMYKSLGKLGEEQVTRIDRALIRFMSVNCLEIIFKTMPKPFAEGFAGDIKRLLPTGKDYNPAGGITLREHKRLPRDAQFIDPKGTTPAKILRTPKSLLKLVREQVIDYSGLQDIMGIYFECGYLWRTVEEYTAYHKTHQQVFARQCGVLYSLYKEALLLDEEYGLQKARDVVQIEARAIILAGLHKADYTNDFSDGTCYFLAKSVNTDFMRMIRYAYYQLEVEQGSSMYSRSRRWGITTSAFRSHYCDYLSMSHQLGSQRDIYPKYLATAHDILARNIRILKDTMLNDQFDIQKEHWKCYENVTIRGAKYFIRTPESLAELTNEATQQHNCVASYAHKVAKGQTIILFMRDKKTPDDSLITVEVGGNVQTGKYLAQAYQAFNTLITEEQAEYLKKWCDKTGVSLKGNVPVVDDSRL